MSGKVNARNAERKLTHGSVIYTAWPTNAVETIVVLLGAVDDFADVGSIDNLAGNINLDVPESYHRGEDEILKIGFDLIVLGAIRVCSLPKAFEDFVAVYNLIGAFLLQQVFDGPGIY